MTQQKLNSLIPMEDPDGNRCFVNQWDVPQKKADGWTVVGKLEQHTSTTSAPVDALTDAGGKPAKPSKGGKGANGKGADDKTGDGAGGGGAENPPAK